MKQSGKNLLDGMAMYLDKGQVYATEDFINILFEKPTTLQDGKSKQRIRKNVPSTVRLTKYLRASNRFMFVDRVPCGNGRKDSLYMFLG